MDQQISILNDRGLITKNTLANQHRLENIGYFKLKGYCLPFYADEATHTFYEGTTFSEVYGSYLVDQKMHRIMYGLLNRVEAQFKSRLGTELGLEFGPLGHYTAKPFRSAQYQRDWLKVLRKNESRALSRDELYVAHYKNKYEDKLPIWVALEMATLGTVSKLYSDMKPKLQEKIASEKYGVPYKYLSSWLQFLTVVRNFCAHNNRTFDKNFSVYPRIAKKVRRKCPELEEPSIFTAFYVMGKVCKSRNFFITSMHEAAKIFASMPDVDISRFGFPADWQEQLKQLK